MRQCECGCEPAECETCESLDTDDLWRVTYDCGVGLQYFTPTRDCSDPDPFTQCCELHILSPYTSLQIVTPIGAWDFRAACFDSSQDWWVEPSFHRTLIQESCALLSGVIDHGGGRVDFVQLKLDFAIVTGNGAVDDPPCHTITPHAQQVGSFGGKVWAYQLENVTTIRPAFGMACGPNSPMTAGCWPKFTNGNILDRFIADWNTDVPQDKPAPVAFADIFNSSTHVNLPGGASFIAGNPTSMEKLSSHALCF